MQWLSYDMNTTYAKLQVWSEQADSVGSFIVKTSYNQSENFIEMYFND